MWSRADKRPATRGASHHRSRFTSPISVRTLFLLLVLANAAFYAYAYVARERETARKAGPELQINADKIRIVRPTVPAACLEWGGIAEPDIARAEAALAALGLPAGAMRRVDVDATGYWVHIPPLKTKADLDKKLGEVKALGVTDFSAIQDPTLGVNAISLGIFSTEEAAQNRLAALKGKGVRSAVMEPRAGIIKQAVFFVREPRTEIVAKLTEARQSFSGSQIKAGPCPAPWKQNPGSGMAYPVEQFGG